MTSPDQSDVGGDEAESRTAAVELEWQRMSRKQSLRDPRRRVAAALSAATPEGRLFAFECIRQTSTSVKKMLRTSRLGVHARAMNTTGSGADITPEKDAHTDESN